MPIRRDDRASKPLTARHVAAFRAPNAGFAERAPPRRRDQILTEIERQGCAAGVRGRAKELLAVLGKSTEIANVTENGPDVATFGVSPLPERSLAAARWTVSILHGSKPPRLEGAQARVVGENRRPDTAIGTPQWRCRGHAQSRVAAGGRIPTMRCIT